MKFEICAFYISLSQLVECYAFTARTTTPPAKVVPRGLPVATTLVTIEISSVSVLTVDEKHETCGWQDGDHGLPVICANNKVCNTADNSFHVLGCCLDASTALSYEPFGCDFFTGCEDYSSDMTRSDRTPSGRDYYNVRQCTDAKYPSCLLYTYPSQSMSQWICSEHAYTLGITMKDARYFPTITPVTSTQDSSTMTASNTVIPASTMSVSSVPAPDTSANKDGIIGGVVGGVGAALLALIAFICWYRQRERNPDELAAESSFTVLGSNIPPEMHRDQPSAEQSQAPRVSALVEADASDSATLRAPDEKHQSVYQPYRPPSAISGPTSQSFYHGPEIVSNPSLGQVSPYQNYNVGSPDMRPISEIHGQSIDVPREPTPTLPEPLTRGPSPLVELEGTSHMSTQSGPVPEWK